MSQSAPITPEDEVVDLVHRQVRPARLGPLPHPPGQQPPVVGGKADEREGRKGEAVEAVELAQFSASACFFLRSR